MTAVGEASAEIVVVLADTAHPPALLPVVQEAVCDHGRCELQSQDDVGEFLNRPEAHRRNTQLVVLLPGLKDPLQLARAAHRASPEAYLVITETQQGRHALTQRMGLTPRLGRHWSIVGDEPAALTLALHRALAAARQRLQLRTTLTQINKRLTQTLAITTSDYERLHASERFLAHFLRNAGEALIGLDAECRVLFWSQGAERHLGVATAHALGKPLTAIGPWSKEVVAASRQLRNEEEVAIEFVATVGTQERAFEAVLRCCYDGSGNALGTSIFLRDVTTRRRAQEQLRQSNLELQQLVSERTHELEKSQFALVQAQKLEALGRLTGGVAHDFNNVLQVIGSNLQLVQAMPAVDAHAKRLLKAALQAVDRGAKLSSHLLAFARRQPLEPVPLNVSRQVQRMDDMLRRSLGEDLEIETALAAGLWTTMVDATQLENVILNLAINARDAMPEGGKLTIETANAVLSEEYAAEAVEVTAGQYVMVAITDTGHGMPPEVVARAFEPFYTTKPEGKGTGLGLSMAYGFAKQSGGHIRIYSEVNLGTAIKLYLPRCFEKEIQPESRSLGPVVGGTETVLVVEDDLAVQAAVVQMLHSLGYAVLRANDAQSALSILQSGMHVDLLFTDVVMPGPLRSPDLARQARAMLPGLAVLFTSGYTHNAIVHGGRLDPGVELLSKPYRQEDLARKVRHLLTEQRARRPAAPKGTLAILLVDDQADLRDVSTQLLEMLNCTVVSVESAEAALPLLAAQRFDVLLTDFSLPGLNGLTLAERARSTQPHIAVIISSGYELPPEATSVERTWTLRKPYEIDGLEVILQAIRNS